MSRKRFVDSIWVRQRMDLKDVRFRAVPARAILPSETYPYASVEIIRAAAPIAPVSETVISTGVSDVRDAFLAHPGTGAQLQALMDDFAAIDQAEAEAAAQLEADRDADEPHGSTCGVGCGFCGRCS